MGWSINDTRASFPYGAKQQKLEEHPIHTIAWTNGTYTGLEIRWSRVLRRGLDRIRNDPDLTTTLVSSDDSLSDLTKQHKPNRICQKNATYINRQKTDPTARALEQSFSGMKCRPAEDTNDEPSKVKHK